MKRHLDIYWVDMNPTRGAEKYKKRPCVILQSDASLQPTRTIIIAPLLPNHKEWPFAINLIPSAMNNLDKPRYINLKQMRAADLSRFEGKYGKLEDDYLPAIANALTYLFGVEHLRVH